ncbi:MAG: phosphoribosylamine--glycine ligase [Thermoplasmata archaeon]
MKAKVLVIGGGGREHAIARALVSSGARIYTVMRNRNPGISRISEKIKVTKETEISAVCEFAKENGVDIAVCGPEEPLVNGIADALEKLGIPCVGPHSRAAMIEGSKMFARELMKKHAIPGAVRFRVVGNIEDARCAFDEYENNFVIKPIGLTGGKGVKVMGEHLKDVGEAMAYVKEIIEKKIGNSQNVLIEEKLEGEEFTLQAFVNEKTVCFSPPVQDHKRLYEGDCGPNTGGMGSYSCENFLLPFLTEEDLTMAREIIIKTVAALKKEGTQYRGFLYGQFMVAADGVHVIEFNCRLGDPEAMNILTLITSNFTELCYKIANGEHLPAPEFKRLATVCKYVVPEGYGINPRRGEEIRIEEEGILKSGCVPYYAMVDEIDGKIYTTTSRSVGIVGAAPTLSEAEQITEKALAFISGKVYVRHDIGKPEVIEKRINHMKALRSMHSS